eukprot:1545469-Prymnesium_polylepis.1
MRTPGEPLSKQLSQEQLQRAAEFQASPEVDRATQVGGSARPAPKQGPDVGSCCWGNTAGAHARLSRAPLSAAVRGPSLLLLAVFAPRRICVS